MKRSWPYVALFVSLLVGSFALMMASSVLAAGKQDPNKPQEIQAIKHTRAAIEQGKAGKAEGLRKEAEAALQIAEAADKMKSEQHIKDGIKHLKLAVEMGQKGDAKEGTSHAEEALKSLEEGHR
jgi:hypothetical protein